MINVFSLTSPHFYITLALSIINAIVLCFVGYKFLQIIQVTGYKIKGFAKWIYDTKARYISRLTFLSVLSFACLMVCNCICASLNASAYFSYIGLLFYFFFAFIFVFKMFQPVKKTPLKYTSRMNRMLITLMIFSSVATFFIIAWSQSLSIYLRFAFIALTPILLLVLVPLVFYILLPLETFIKYCYVLKAKSKLKKIEKTHKLIKIGITGSFGKTSTKFILEAMLKQKYKVCVSPASFNTTMGITKVILNDLNDKHDVLICEMGARHRYDIAKIAKFVKPNAAILTAVGAQHMETFKTIDNIAKTKYELVENTTKDGLVVYNFGDNENKFIKDLYEKTTITKYKTGIFDDADLKAENIKVSDSGTTFDIVDSKADKNVTCQTKLLGDHNIENILAAAKLANLLGVTLDEIKQAVSELKPVEHRLQLIKAETGVTILDDSYNSSVVGCKMALDVLSKFNGRKFILTPGLVEMGKSQFEANFKIGEAMAGVVDEVIIVNELNKEAISKGLLSKGFKEDKISYATNLEAAKIIMGEKLKKGDIILFENDLPDNFV